MTNPKEGKSTPKKLGATAQLILDILSEDPYLKREEIAARAGLKLEGLKYQLAQLNSLGNSNNAIRVACYTLIRN